MLSLGAVAKEGESDEVIPRGGRLVVALANPVHAREPVVIDLDEEAEVLTNVFETLIAIDHEGNLAPALCEKWEVSDDGRSFLLKLRGGVRFQDGHVFTAEDVKSSFERAIRQGSRKMPAAFAAIRGVAEFVEKEVNEIAGIVVHADDRLEIRLQEPLPIYPALLTDHHTSIVSVASEKPIGTGPFRIVSQDDHRIELERNSEYWRSNPATLDAIEFRLASTRSASPPGCAPGSLTCPATCSRRTSKTRSGIRGSVADLSKPQRRILTSRFSTHLPDRRCKTRWFAAL